MKLFATLCIVILLGALISPFFITINGRPLLSLDKVIDDATPEMLSTPTTVYRWQDEQGRWQFDEQPPQGVTAKRIEVDEQITRMDGGWHVKPLTEASDKNPLGSGAPGIAGFVEEGATLMDRASNGTRKLNERATQMERVRRSLH